MKEVEVLEGTVEGERIRGRIKLLDNLKGYVSETRKVHDMERAMGGDTAQDRTRLPLGQVLLLTRW